MAPKRANVYVPPASLASPEARKAARPKPKPKRANVYVPPAALAKPVRVKPKRANVYVPPAKLARPAPTRAPRPTPMQLKSARAQQAAYVSQGKAVEKAARQQKAAVKQYKAEAPGRYYASLANDKPAIQFSKEAAGAHKLERTTGDKVTLERDGHYYRQVRRRFLPDTKVPVNPITGKQDSKYQTSKQGMRNAGQVAQESEVTHAAGLKVLDQAMRPSHAIAGGTRAAIKGENVIKAGARGLKLKDRYTGSDVLAAAGVHNKALRGVGGFAFDVGTDPLTYVTGGTSSVAKEAAASAARQAEKQAVKAGIGEGAAKTAARETAHASERAVAAGKSTKTAAQIAEDARAAADVAKTAAQKAAGERAAKRAVAQAPRGKGVTVRFAGKRIGGQHGTRATAAVGRQVGKTVRVVPGSAKVAAGARRFASNVAPGVRRAGAREAEHVGGRQVAREARATQQSLQAKAEHLTSRLGRQLHEGDHERLISALEHNDLSRLVAPNAKAEAKLKAINPGEHARRRALAQNAHEVRSKLEGAHRIGKRAGTFTEDVGGASKFLTSADTKKLRQAIKTEPKRQAGRVVQLQRNELRAQGKAEVAQEVAVGRAQREAAVATERGAGQARVQQAQQAGRARAATEKVRGQEAKRVGVQTARAKGEARLGREQAIGAIRRVRDSARIRLRAELRKPVAKRKGVATLQARVDAAERELALVRKHATFELKTRVAAAEGHQRIEPAAPVSAIRPKVAPPPRVAPGPAVSVRAGKAAGKYESRAAQTQAAMRRLEASKNIPARRVVESDEQYLHRVADYADTHDLKTVGDRARKLLASKPTGTAKGYFPREFDARILKRLGLTPAEGRAAGARGRPGTSRAVPKITAGYKRADQGTLEQVNALRDLHDQAQFSTDVPLVVLNHLKEVGRAASAGEYAKGMAEHGRPLPKRKATETAAEWQARVHAGLGDGEAIYRLGYEGGQFKLHDVTGKLPRQRTEQEIATATPGERALAGRSAGKRSGQYVILHKPTVDGLQAATEQIAAGNDLIKVLDGFTGVFKRRAVATVAFHIRNAIGDLIQHYTASGTHAWNVPANVRRGLTAARRAGQLARAEKPGQSTRTIKIAGKDVPLDEHVRNAIEDGVVDTGYLGREEYRSLSAAGRQQAGRVRGVAPRALKKVPGAKATTEQAARLGKFLKDMATNRENTTRLATYTTGLDQGLTRREAADLANRVHIDYGDLSATEQQILRRVLPFYTWTSRSIPVVAKSMIKYPGRTLALEKAREEIGQAFTGETEAQQRARMSESVQRQLPVVIRAFGQPRALSFSAPQNLLNEMPTGLDSKSFASWFDENRRFWGGALSPFIRAPIELATGTNIVTRREIEKKDRPLVAAPAWVKRLPGRAQKALDVTDKFIDPKTGKTTTGWRGRADWTYDQVLLGWQGQAAQLLGAGRNPTVEKGAAAASLGGLRVDPLGEQAAKVAGQQRTYDELNKVGRRIGILQQQGITVANETPEYRRLLDRQKALKQQLPTVKTKKAAGGGGGFAGFGGGGGGGKIMLGGG